MSFNSLRLCTFNCCSLRKNIDLVRGLADARYDIIFLQETFITEEKLGELDFIDENYNCVGAPATYSEKAVKAGAGRPEGGGGGWLYYGKRIVFLKSMEFILKIIL